VSPVALKGAPVRVRSILVSVAFCFVAACGTPVTAVDGGYQPLYAPGAAVAGKQCPEFAEGWLAWLYSFPDGPTHPGRSGDCSQGLRDGLFYLPSASSGTTTAACDVPANVPVVAPLRATRRGYSCPEAFGAADCAYGTDAGASLLKEGFDATGFDGISVEVDGKAVDAGWEEYFCEGAIQLEPPPPEVLDGGHSFLFDAMSGVECMAPWDAGNVCGLPAGPRTFLVNGYFVALKPLGSGTHTLHLKGCVNGAKCGDKTYELTGK